jgi:outer membrane protein assembly factor BamA
LIKTLSIALLFLAFLNTNPINATEEKHQVVNIIIKGNKITKSPIILRELTIKKGEFIGLNEIKQLIIESRNNLTNTNLFNFITIEHELNNNELTITIEIVERWYIWPYPILEISDRNFNVWWDEFKSSNYSDFSRLNYGVFLNIENFRGLNELLMIKFRKGFKEHYLFRYETPHINNNKTFGINTQIEFFRRRKTYFQTKENELQYFEENDTYTSKEMLLDLELLYRDNIKTRHKLKFNFHRSNVNAQIPLLNPNYLQNNDSTGSFYKISYQFINENRDNNTYPLEGYYLEFEISKYFELKSPINHYEINSHLEKHIKISDKLYSGTSLRTRTASSNQQVYFATQTLGFDDYVRGYEFYVIDGEDYYLSKTAIKYVLINKRNLEIPYIKKKQFSKSHFSIYATVFSDLGYTSNNTNYNENSLANTLLWGRGCSIEYVTYYDKMLRIEFSINKLGEKGLFLHFSSPFGETNRK